MHRLLRRLSILLLIALLASCATTEQEAPEDAGDEQAVEQVGPVGDGPAEAPAPGGPDAGTAVDDEAPASDEQVEPGPPEPQTVLRFLEPSDLTSFESAEISLRVAVDAQDLDIRQLEVQLLGGTVVDGSFNLIDAAELPVAERSATVRVPRSGVVNVTLPPGLVDGSVYTWRARAALDNDTATEWFGPQETRLALGYDPPVAGPMEATVDTTPSLSWQTTDEFRFYQLRLEDSRGSILGEAAAARPPFTVSEVLTPGTYILRIRGLRQDGIATAFSAPSTLRLLADAAPSTVWPVGDEATFGTRVGLHWRPVPGAASYEAQLRGEGGDWEALGTTAESFISVPESLESGQRFQWRVRAVAENGRVLSWSRTGSFVVDTRESLFLPVIGPGESAEYSRGYEGGSRDERPVSRVTLTLPFEMARTAMTNTEVVRIVNYALERGYAEADATGVYSVSGDPLIGLAEMDYGRQLGLVYDDGALQAAAGYQDHPAVGITWNGALALANFLSFVEGRAPAYDIEAGTWNRESNGYRLPTEAEWEYAARGDTDRLLPWGSSLTGRVANYYRSFDPFEDVNEPFTSAGGPTTPAGYFDGSVQSNFRTTSSASPFGILDMVGNTWEWCWDRYDAEYYSDSTTVDPAGPDNVDRPEGDAGIVLAVTLDPDQRVVRGTAWNSRATDVRLTNRGRYTQLGRSYSIGVRLVRPPR